MTGLLFVARNDCSKKRAVGRTASPYLPFRLSVPLFWFDFGRKKNINETKNHQKKICASLSKKESNSRIAEWENLSIT